MSVPPRAPRRPLAAPLPRQEVASTRRPPAPATPPRPPLLWLPDAHWGTATTPLPPVTADDPDDTDPDDELLAVTPPDVVAMLGFDPLTDPDVLAMDANWKEDDHKRDADGRFSKTSGGGGKSDDDDKGSSSEEPEDRAQPPMRKLEPHTMQRPALKKIYELVRNGVDKKEDPKTLADKLKEIVGDLKRPAIAEYANRIIDWLERENGLDPGSLGRAKSKGETGDDPPPPEPPKTPAKKQEVEKEKPDPPKPAHRKIEDIKSETQETLDQLMDADDPEQSKTLRARLEQLIAEHKAAKDGAKPSPPGKTYSDLSIAEMTRRKFQQTEIAWHESAWTDADARLRHAISKTATLMQPVQQDATTGACFWPGGSSINMSRYERGTGEGDAVWRHEFGHAMDDNGTGEYSSFHYDEDRKKDAEQFLGRRSMADPHEKYLEALDEEERTQLRALAKTDHRYMLQIASVISEGPAKHFFPTDYSPSYNTISFNDFLGAMTHNQVGWGHSNDYYTVRPNRHCAEMFANYVSLTGGKNGKIWRRLLHAYAPRACKGFDAIIDARAGGGS